MRTQSRSVVLPFCLAPDKDTGQRCLLNKRVRAFPLPLYIWGVIGSQSMSCHANDLKIRGP